jgi:hypothetical protein
MRIRNTDHSFVIPHATLTIPLLYLTFDSGGPEGDDDHGLLLVPGGCGVRLPHEDTQLRP